MRLYHIQGSPKQYAMKKKLEDILVLCRISAVGSFLLLSFITVAAEPSEMSDLALELYYDEMQRWRNFYRPAIIVCTLMWATGTLGLMFLRKFKPGWVLVIFLCSTLASCESSERKRLVRKLDQNTLEVVYLDTMYKPGDTLTLDRPVSYPKVVVVR